MYFLELIRVGQARCVHSLGLHITTKIITPFHKRMQVGPNVALYVVCWGAQADLI